MNRGGELCSAMRRRPRIVAIEQPVQLLHRQRVSDILMALQLAQIRLEARTISIITSSVDGGFPN
jgi:hypothetical protein